MSSGESIASFLISLAAVLAAARVGGYVAGRIGQPQVLGELAAGVIVGNLTLIGFHGLDTVSTESGVGTLARLGVIVLLFQVGLESSWSHMRRVGLSSLLAAVFGIIGSFLLGWVTAAWLLPSATSYARLFVAASLTATSVSITARVLKELGRLRSDEARVILGAAIIDDVIGLVILAVMTGLISTAGGGSSLAYSSVAWVFLKTTIFLAGSFVFGVLCSRYVVSFAIGLKSGGALLAFGLGICVLFAWLASALGLAPIVGAFAAGLMLEDLQSAAFVSRGRRSLRDLVDPIGSFLVPIFFVVTGARTDLTAFSHPGTLSLALGLTLAAVLGKQCCALGVVDGRLDRLSIGFGMMPRGEVQLIFASAGLTLMIAGRAVIDDATFSAIVVMVMLTTMLTPMALRWSFGRSGTRH